MPTCRPGAVVLLAVPLALLAPGAAAEALADARGDAGQDGLDVVEVAWSVGNATATVEARFAPGEVPADRAVRGVLLLGAPGAAEPAEWYQFTIAGQTTAFAGHGEPRDARVVATSWTGDVARVEVERSGPAPAGSCAFAVVEAGTMGPEGFVRSDVAPGGFASPEQAWPVDSCPEGSFSPTPSSTGAGRGSPGVATPVLLLGLAAAAAGVLRRR